MDRTKQSIDQIDHQPQLNFTIALFHSPFVRWVVSGRVDHRLKVLVYYRNQHNCSYCQLLVRCVQRCFNLRANESYEQLKSVNVRANRETPYAKKALFGCPAVVEEAQNRSAPLARALRGQEAEQFDMGTDAMRRRASANGRDDRVG
jgi:hypothetical protein